MISGVMNIYKERGFTSHDVVAKLRSILHEKRIGHTGTLDPEAEGVLLVCLGKATSLCGMLTDYTKIYETVMQLGVVTDTQDMTGKVLSRTDIDTLMHLPSIPVSSKAAPAADITAIMNVVEGFVGEYSQIPPMYSALKVKGKKLYELARAGVTVERKPRNVTIYAIRVNEIDQIEHTVRMTIVCSKGTYIRTLCHDIGQKLGCGACMKELTRIAVGGFTLSQAVTLGQVQAKNLLGCVNELIIPVDEMFAELPKYTVNAEYDVLVHNGGRLASDGAHITADKLRLLNQKMAYEMAEEQPGRVRLYDSQGVFVGVYAFQADELVPVKMFYDSEG